MYRYQLEFKLSEPLRFEHLEEANEYLHDNDMTQFFTCEFRSPEQQAMKDILAHVEWKLKDVNGGVVDIITSSPLTDRQKNLVYGEILGQNTDGLGEGFEQQDFANWREEEERYIEWVDAVERDENGKVISEGYFEDRFSGERHESEWDFEDWGIDHCSYITGESEIKLIDEDYKKEDLYENYHHVDVNLSDLIYDDTCLDDRDDFVMDEP